MKNLIASVAAIALVATPALAQMSNTATNTSAKTTTATKAKTPVAKEARAEGESSKQEATEHKAAARPHAKKHHPACGAARTFNSTRSL